jgi:hypothetical protein
MNTLIRCTDCDLIYAATPFEDTPEYLYSEFEDEKARHEGHQTEELIILDPALYSEGKYFDPCRVTYLTATNGKKTLLIKKWRESINEPLRYDVVHGRLQVKKSIAIQKDDLLKQLLYEIKDPSFKGKVPEFIKIVEDEALSLNSEQVSDETFESSDAQISYYPLKEEHISRILHRCSAGFTQEECERIELFIRNNCEGNEVMSLVVRKTARLVRPKTVKRHSHYTHTPEISHPLHLKS